MTTSPNQKLRQDEQDLQDGRGSASGAIRVCPNSYVKCFHFLQAQSDDHSLASDAQTH
jgi:hypothetical protein